MILNLILNTLYLIIYAITSPIRLLPDVTLPVGFTSAIQTASGYLASLNVIIPVDTVILLLGIYVAIELAYLTFKIIMWIIKRFPTQS